MAKEEPIDLEPERQKEILALEARVETGNHFEVLGVPLGSTTDEIRQAFRELSRKFHPDRYFGKQLGPFKAKIDRVFKRMVEANQVLTDPDKRKAYLDANAHVRAAVKAAGGASAAPQAQKPKSAEDEARDAERRARLAKHPYLAKAGRVQELILKAKESIAKADFSQAFQHLNQVAQFDPQHAEARALLVEVRRQYERLRSENDYKRGLEALERGDEELGIQALKAAVAAYAKNDLAAFKLAQLVDRRGNSKEASTYAQKAVDAAPGNIGYRLFLGRTLEDNGMKALAKKQYEEAAKLDPNHPEVKKQGKKLWPF